MVKYNVWFGSMECLASVFVRRMSKSKILQRTAIKYDKVNMFIAFSVLIPLLMVTYGYPLPVNVKT